MTNRLFATLLCIVLCYNMAYSQNKNNPYKEFKPIEVSTDLSQAADCKTELSEEGELSAAYTKLLGYTHKELQRYLDGKELIELFVSTSKIGKKYFVDIQYLFNSVKGVDNYGSFSKGSPIKLILLNKETLYLNNLKNVRGKYSQKKQISMLQGSYQLDDYELKQLQKSPVLTIEVSYEYGTESYPIENIDLFRQQLHCLDNN